ncbi:hypothetical protein TNCV_3079001 [Trichonephila clavipes]|nr:hypothetical protein TNCV_3079001 [Trichonephila clavipes]
MGRFHSVWPRLRRWEFDPSCFLVLICVTPKHGVSRLAEHNYNLTLTTMASNNYLPTNMDFQNATLPKSGNSTPERSSGPTSCARLEATKADIRRYTLIVQGFENMISLRQSKAQDEHDPTFVEMVKQCSMYEDLEKAVSEFGNLPYCDTPGCPVHETPSSSSVKSQPTKRKDEDGLTSLPPPSGKSL